MHKPESVRQNEMIKILWSFEIQKDHLIPTNRPDLVLINKKEELYLIGIILRWGFLIWELIFFFYCGLFVLI